MDGCFWTSFYSYNSYILIILHAGTNDARTSAFREIKEKLPECRVIISTTTYRSANGRAALTGSHLRTYILELKTDFIDNKNINAKHLLRRGLHINSVGSNLLAKIF